MPSPRLLIDYACEDDSSFVIEELTFNPYISLNSILGKNPVDIWVEFSIRNTQERCLDVPEIRLKFIGDHSDIFFPRTNIPNHIAGIEDSGDMNFVMYSDIWYSFVRLEGQDREFMEHGYKKPIRIISSINDSFSPSESWITGEYHIFRRGLYQREADDLFNRVNKFYKSFSSFYDITDNVCHNETLKRGNKEIKCLIPSDRSVFAPVYFEVYNTPLKGRFAVRRQPWNEEAQDIYGIGYGGTAEITRHDQTTYTIKPRLFSEQDSKSKKAKLSKDEIIRFWLYFQSASCLTISKSQKDRTNFAFKIEVKPKIETFNSFFRVPIGFEPTPGAITELLHYPTPPRLFFLWDQYFPEQCFAYSKNINKTNSGIELSSVFENKNTEAERLVKLFVLGVLMSFLANLHVGTLLSFKTASDTKAMPVAKEISFLALFHFEFTAAVAVIMGIISAVRVYKKKRIDLGRTIFSILCITICVVPFYWNKIIGGILFFSFIIFWVTSLGWERLETMNRKEILKKIEPKFFSSLKAKKKFLRELRIKEKSKT